MGEKKSNTIDPFAEMLTEKDREVYEAFGAGMRKWLVDNHHLDGEGLADNVEAVALIFTSLLACYVSSSVEDDDQMLAHRCTVDIVTKQLDRCFVDARRMRNSVLSKELVNVH